MTRRLTAALVVLVLLLACGTALAQSAGRQGQLAAIDSVTPGARDFLEPAAPTPFGENGTVIAFSLAQDGPVRIRVLDFFYGLVATPIDEVLPAGRTAISFVPPGTMSSGMYFIELRTERGVQQRRVLFLQ